MENYSKGRNEEEPFDRESIPIPNLPQNFLWMEVKGGTKIHNVLTLALQKIDDKENTAVVWSASGGGVTKAITCAEIMKRKHKMHQVTQICYRKLEEYWDPKLEELEQIVVTRRVPAVHILLSLQPINSTLPCYQGPDNANAFWKKQLTPNSDSNQPGTSGASSKFQRHKNNNSGGVTTEFAAMGLRTASTQKQLKRKAGSSTNNFNKKTAKDNGKKET